MVYVKVNRKKTKPSFKNIVGARYRKKRGNLDGFSTYQKKDKIGCNKTSLGNESLVPNWSCQSGLC